MMFLWQWTLFAALGLANARERNGLQERPALRSVQKALPSNLARTKSVPQTERDKQLLGDRERNPPVGEWKAVFDRAQAQGGRLTDAQRDASRVGPFEPKGDITAYNEAMNHYHHAIATHKRRRAKSDEVAKIAAMSLAPPLNILFGAEALWDYNHPGNRISITDTLGKKRSVPKIREQLGRSDVKWVFNDYNLPYHDPPALMKRLAEIGKKKGWYEHDGRRKHKWDFQGPLLTQEQRKEYGSESSDAAAQQLKQGSKLPDQKASGASSPTKRKGFSKYMGMFKPKKGKYAGYPEEVPPLSNAY